MYYYYCDRKTFHLSKLVPVDFITCHPEGPCTWGMSPQASLTGGHALAM